VKTWTTIASFGAGITVLATLAIAVPHSMWATDGLTAMTTLLLSIVLPAMLPAPIPRGEADDATSIFLIGPLAALYASLIVLSIGALWLALVGDHTWSFVADVLWLGTLVIGYSLLQASTRLVGLAAAQTGLATEDPRARWSSVLRVLSARTADNDALRQLFNNLAERVRYSSNEGESRQAGETQSITTLLSQLELTLGNPDQCIKIVRSTEVLLEQREQSLRALRARA
jgi:hypothetical protein